MRVSSWQGVILSWANALKLSEEPINDVLDLVRKNFFVRLLRKIKNEADFEENVTEGDVYRVIEDFLKDQYGGFRLLGYWDNDEVTLVSSVLLLWASLQSQDFRTPLYDLNNIVQLKIHAFLEQFVETPQHLINRQIVMEAVLDIPSDDETEDDSSSYISSPRTYSTPKRSSQYSPGFLALSEVRSLRGKVELLSCEKQHLQDELDLTKTQLKETITKLNSQKSEYKRLISVLSTQEEDKDLCDEKGDRDHLLRNEHEYVSLKLELEEIKEDLKKLRLELELTIENKNNLSKKLVVEEKARIDSEHKCIEMESKILSSNGRIEELEDLILSLKKTCEEQQTILEEKQNTLREESFCYNEGETLDSIVDIKYSELKEELKLQSELLEEKSNELKKLLNEKANDETTIKKLTEELKKLKLHSSLQEKVPQCNECQNVKEELATLKKDFNEICCESIKLQERLDKKTIQLKLINNNKVKDEACIAELKANVNSLIADNHMKCNELREEIVALKCDLCEKNNNIEYFKDEVDFLSTCLKERNIEMKNLEDDYNKINTSKDKEIAQLIITVDHLSREIKRLEDQLHGQYFKNEKLVQSAFQWRQKMTQENTANEELARELISLHETLEWKNFKLKEFSLQIEQFKSELSDKSTLNKELHERLSFFSDRNKEYHKELQTNKNTITQLQSKISSLEFNEKKLNQENTKNEQKVNLLESELRDLQKVLHEKFFQIELELESHFLKGNFGVQELLQFVDFLIDTLKENKRKIKVLNQVIAGLESDYTEKSVDLEHFKCKIEQLTVDSGMNSVVGKQDNEELTDKLMKIENELENHRVKLEISLQKLEKAIEEANKKDIVISHLEEEIEKLSKQQTEKMDLIDHLTQNVNLYEHEKSILEKKLKNLSLQTGVTNSVKAENMVLKNDVVILEKQLEEERENLKTIEQQTYLEEKLSSVFDEKLTVIQAKMAEDDAVPSKALAEEYTDAANSDGLHNKKEQYEEDMNNMTSEYTKKIEQLKIKIKKDCLHIEQLSSDLWETSDRLVLAQQESEALRSQLRITRQMLADHQMQKRGMEDSHSFMWLGGVDAVGFIDEMVTTVTTKRTIQAASNEDDNDEDFNQQCLDDLKAGICRVQSERLSCPPSTSSHNVDMESKFFPPPEKPRKLKGTITYRKPGPPTPSINAARHSLPGNEKLEHKKGLREHNPNTGQVRNRLSQLFGSINLSKVRNVQESPKVKRKGFFQRTFGNRENIPPK